MMTLCWHFWLKLQQLSLIRNAIRELSLTSEILIVKSIVNSNMNSAPIIRRQLLHVFIFHSIGFESLATMLVSANMFRKLVLQSLTSRDVSAPGSPFTILDWTCCYRLSDLCSRIGYFTGFVTDCPCGVGCRELTTCLLYVGPRFGN